ncbi:phenylacetate--CoA ligase [Acrocarpospora pleiomorpha]|uniref:Phenylacetate--CoA ligase n=1 Tax=Acrocarpospora pleiomorpha TaxID=90975 RepID=A0A5M3XFE1_9ACTN|nr:phenylacetate--CoA ligase family protein [Acrocarpospora pleiomorpha]GES19366.1 phenylacetate--CoA ligase [Acrocarpospora pleiomorpha]
MNHTKNFLTANFLTANFLTANFLRAGSLEAAVASARFAQALPAYADEFGQLDISPESWTDVPLLTKEQLIEGVTDAAPYGRRLGADLADIAWVFVAPGPIFMPFTASDIDALAERFAGTFRSCGFTSSDVVDQTTLYNWVIAGTILGKALEKVGATAVPGGSGDTQRHIEVIEGLGVTAILAFPTFLVHLLDTAAAQGRTLPLKRAIVMGELHDPREKDRIQREYGVSVREFYGTADVGPVAAECGVEPGMHLREDVFVEFVNPRTGEPVTGASASEPAELVVTDPVRRAMPIVRLRTGDLVDSVTAEPCACGTATPRIGRIVGRVGDITKVKGMFVVPGSVKSVLLRHRLVTKYQLVVSRDAGRDTLVLRVEGSRPGGWDRILDEVSHTLRVRCESEFVERIEGDAILLDQRTT